jgi:hypothetical protein
LVELRARLQTIVKGLPDLSFYPESHLVGQALDAPVEFGQAHATEIARLVDTADLALRPYDRVRAEILKAIQSEDPMVRYWGAMVCSSFGGQASDLAGSVRLLLKDTSPVVRVRAAEFLGLIGQMNPQPLLTSIVNETDNPVLATEALNSIVLFRDFFQDRYPVDRSDFDPVSKGADIDDRLNYINGVPYPPKPPKTERQRKKSKS